MKKLFLIVFLLASCMTEDKKDVSSNSQKLKNKDSSAIEITRLTEETSCDNWIEKTAKDIKEKSDLPVSGSLIVFKSENGECKFYHVNKLNKQDLDIFSDKILMDCRLTNNHCKKIALVSFK
ncbi:MAG TPA: hypothetical protein PK079_06670 [Leptospiraceae bacterium]|nr:hypothetical protein [Leptospiraceae bacterium]HMW06979.1 hypothetical protein [Leptospiraceae bacterium]HMX32648.1 hypothetical protein [Leptospiraceae bacterium]HMY30373.1 hypothetical protein [Leptospiraceae bacterium]HMZ65887.1 hypothetical protein [Leptospiraceae bacterium]